MAIHQKTNEYKTSVTLTASDAGFVYAFRIQQKHRILGISFMKTVVLEPIAAADSKVLWNGEGGLAGKVAQMKERYAHVYAAA